MLLSTSSFTTDAGRSTTSPAATWLARVSGRSLIRLIRFLILSPFDSLRSQPIDYTHHEFICCPEEAPTFWRPQGKLSDVQDITFAHRNGKGRLFRSAIRDDARSRSSGRCRDRA